jgi:hypothetical protein
MSLGLYGRLRGWTDHKAGGLLRARTAPQAVSVRSIMPEDALYPPMLSYLRECRPLEDQGQYPRCAAYAVCCNLQAQVWRDTGRVRDFDEARLYAEANANDGIEGDGTTLDAAVKAAQTVGYAKDFYPRWVASRNELRWAVWRTRFVVCGFQVTENWNRVNSRGIIPDGGAPIGGHAVLVCGYGSYGPIVANSWGTRWGINGYGQLSWEAFDDQFMGGLAVEWKL